MKKSSRFMLQDVVEEEIEKKETALKNEEKLRATICVLCVCALRFET